MLAIGQSHGDEIQRKSTLPLPPGSYGLPFIGEAIAWRRNPLEFLQRRYELHRQFAGLAGTLKTEGFFHGPIRCSNFA